MTFCDVICLFMLNFRHCFSLSLISTCLSLSPSLRAESLHHDITPAATLTWPTVIDAALAQRLGQTQIDIRREAAQTLSDRSTRWLAAPPALQGRYQTGDGGPDLPLREWEVGVELPLWRWGQRQAAQSEANAAQTLAQQTGPWLRWQVHGALQEAYWSLLVQDWLVTCARDDHARAQALLNEVTRRVRAGDAPKLERLRVEQVVLEREQAVQVAEGQRKDQAIQWHLLTGLAQRPVEPELSNLPAPIDRSIAPALWPPVQRAQQQAQQSQAAWTAAQAQGAGQPRVLIGHRDERLGPERVDSIGATFTLPFGSASDRAALALPARLKAAEDADLLHQTQRDAERMQHEALHEQALMRAHVTAQAQLQARAREEHRLMTRAYQLGEISLTERLASDQRWADTVRQYGLLLRHAHRATARVQQAFGQTP